MIDPMTDNTDNWWKGIIYINKKDKRVSVPKQNFILGWTLNFGNPLTYILIIIMITAFVFASIYI